MYAYPSQNNTSNYATVHFLCNGLHAEAGVDPSQHTHFAGLWIPNWRGGGGEGGKICLWWDGGGCLPRGDLYPELCSVVSIMIKPRNAAAYLASLFFSLTPKLINTEH